MYIRPDGKCQIGLVVTVEQKKMFEQMKKDGYNPQVPLRKMADEVIKTYLKIKNMDGGKNE